MIVTEAIRYGKRASAPKTEKARKRTATRGEAKRCLGVVFRVTLSLARSLLSSVCEAWEQHIKSRAANKASECEGDSAGML